MLKLEATQKPNSPAFLWVGIFYAVLSLGSMATMSIGAAGVFLVILLNAPSFYHSLRQEGDLQFLRVAGLLWISILLSLVVARVWPLGFGGQFIQVQWWSDLSKVWYFLWPMVLGVLFLQLTEDQFERVLRVWLGAAGVVSAIGIAQYWTGWPHAQLIPYSPGHYHATMFFGHHLSTASILIFPFFSALGFLKQSFGPSSKYFKGAKERIFLFAIFILTGGALFFSYSKTVWASLPMGLALFFFTQFPKKWRFPSLVGVILVSLLATQLPMVRHRLQDGVGLSDRVVLWKANWEFFKLRPLTGVGFRHTSDASSYYLQFMTGQKEGLFIGHAHNMILEMLGGVGLLGTLAWLAWVLWVFKLYLRLGRLSGFSSWGWGLVAAWFVFQLNGLTQVNFWEGKVMHQMMFALALAWSVLRREQKTLEIH